ncbi:hypothetical protein [Nocardia sp. BMG51109]|uniref:hypothetical protein n=1 Tax=Nocardia sp. BMG51109 TaxID=1056816 RepID=UPI0004634319|nr:hypothetical protein [Nocardia sp. BMG51109]
MQQPLAELTDDLTILNKIHIRIAELEPEVPARQPLQRLLGYVTWKTEHELELVRHQRTMTEVERPTMTMTHPEMEPPTMEM